jgi:hypothetical protein
MNETTSLTTEPVTDARQDDAHQDLPRQEGFLDRWSRVKREVKGGAVPPGTVATNAAPEPPSLERLAEEIAQKGMDADFSAFMQQGVDAGVRRTAIQQLFKQPAFNVMDGLDVYIENFNLYEALPASELPGIAHARALLFPELEQTETAEEAAAEEIKAAVQEPISQVSPKEHE